MERRRRLVQQRKRNGCCVFCGLHAVNGFFRAFFGPGPVEVGEINVDGRGGGGHGRDVRTARKPCGNVAGESSADGPPFNFMQKTARRRRHARNKCARENPFIVRPPRETARAGRAARTVCARARRIARLQNRPPLHPRPWARPPEPVARDPRHATRGRQGATTCRKFPWDR